MFVDLDMIIEIDPTSLPLGVFVGLVRESNDRIWPRAVIAEIRLMRWCAPVVSMMGFRPSLPHVRPASFRNGGRHHPGIPGGIIPLYPGGFVGIRIVRRAHPVWAACLKSGLAFSAPQPPRRSLSQKL